jgi:hypothetical protein
MDVAVDEPGQHRDVNEVGDVARRCAGRREDVRDDAVRQDDGTRSAVSRPPVHPLGAQRRHGRQPAGSVAAAASSARRGAGTSVAAGSGAMLAFDRNTLSGSQRAFSAASRRYFCSP